MGFKSGEYGSRKTSFTPCEKAGMSCHACKTRQYLSSHILQQGCGIPSDLPLYCLLSTTQHLCHMTSSHVTIHLLASLPPLHLFLLDRHSSSQQASVIAYYQGRFYQVCSDIISCICIQTLVDILRGSRDCSFGFLKQYQCSLGYTCLQSLFPYLSLFGLSINQYHSWVFTPL